MIRHRFVFLLAALLFVLIFAPILHLVAPGSHPILARTIFAILFAVLLLSAVMAASEHPRTMLIAWTIALPTCLLHGLALLFENSAIVIANHIISSLFLLFTVGVILKYLFIASHVTFDMICASLCVYLLLSVVWAIAYSLIEILQPGSFHFALGDASANRVMRFEGERAFLAIYYSLVTITTLGYGDILPTSSLARTTAATKALTGQLFLVVLVARLVGLHIAQATARGDRR